MSDQSHKLEIELNKAAENDDCEKIKQILANPDIDINYKVIFFYYIYDISNLKSNLWNLK